MTFENEVAIGGSLADCVEASYQTPAVVMRDGRAVAVVFPVADDEDAERLLMANSAKLRTILDRSHRSLRQGKGLTLEQVQAEVAKRQATRAAERTPAGVNGQHADAVSVDASLSATQNHR